MSLKNANSLPIPPRTMSITTRLTLMYVATASAVLLCTAGVLYWALTQQLAQKNRQTLLTEVEELRALLREHPNEPNVLAVEVVLEKANQTEFRDFARVLDEQGRIIVETPRMNESVPIAMFSATSVSRATEPIIRLWRAETGRNFLLMTASAEEGIGSGKWRSLQLALDITDQEIFLAVYRRQIAVVLVVGIAISAFASALVASRSLRPLNEIAHVAERISVSQLHERIGQRGWSRELTALAGAFDAMFGRLGRSFQQLTKFSADIAHELRSPLQNLSGEIEVALSRARTTDDYREVLTSALEECQKLSRLVDSLLFLARAEHPETQIHREGLNVAHELATIRDFYEGVASEAAVTLALDAPDGLCLDADRTMFQRAIGNLLENALAHTPRGGNIHILGTHNSNTVCIEVADTGCGIPAESLPYLFDRFYRPDPARSRTTGGAGLGLSIVQSIMHLHRGTVDVQSQVGTGTRVTLRFPQPD